MANTLYTKHTQAITEAKTAAESFDRDAALDILSPHMNSPMASKQINNSKKSFSHWNHSTARKHQV
jgi:hypothetical protein